MIAPPGARCGACVHHVGGECRRYPPKGTIGVYALTDGEPGPDPVPLFSLVEAWPQTDDDEHCSEFVPMDDGGAWDLPTAGRALVS